MESSQAFFLTVLSILKTKSTAVLGEMFKWFSFYPFMWKFAWSGEARTTIDELPLIRLL